MPYRKRRKKNKALIKLYNDVSDASGIHRNTTKAVIEALWPILKQAIIEGYEVTIPGFGQFQQRMRMWRINPNVNDVSKNVYSPESSLVRFEPEKDWKQEHYLANAIIPTPEEYVGQGFPPISYRFWDAIREKYGEEILETVYKQSR